MKKDSNKKKVVKYRSSDKVYAVNKKNKSKLVIPYNFIVFSIIFSVLMVIFSSFMVSNSIDFNDKMYAVGYNEIGNTDYKVLLKENNYYKTKYLSKDMQYISSLINAINADFNYRIVSEDSINYEYKYKINAQLLILDRINDKVLLKQDYPLLTEQIKKINTNDLSIKENIDIDYDEYNDYVNDFKRNYGVSINSKLVVYMDIDIKGKNKNTTDEINENRKFEIEIPLNEQTIDIKYSEDINNSNSISSDSQFKIKNCIIFIIGIILFIVSIISLVYTIKTMNAYRKENIYKIIVSRILREYDKIIVNGKIEIDESNYINKVYPNKFIEMVDASQNLNSPILYYEVIPNEKCFFVIVKDNTIYKYRISKAYLENQEIEEIEEEINIKIKNKRK